MNLIETRIKKADYENVIVDCPHCKKEIIYNRSTDLIDKSASITGTDVKCLECQKLFWISGDSANLSYEQLFLKAKEQKRQKNYRDCIALYCSSLEMFFSHGIQSRLLWYSHQQDIIDLTTMNNLTKEFIGKNYTFEDLKNIFNGIYYLDKKFSNKKEIEDFINKKDTRSFTRPSWDSEEEELFKILRSSDINACRNKVLHSKGYRPSLAEVEKYEKDTVKIVFALGGKLKLGIDALSIINSK